MSGIRRGSRLFQPCSPFAVEQQQTAVRRFGDQQDLPASLRFFAGGDRSVRGYAYQSLGPKDENGQVIGGKHLLVANLEIEKKVTAKWGGAIFYDIGNAFDSLSEYELEQGAGIGIRRYTTIGPIRVDLARQIGNRSPRWRIHLSMGFGW